MSTRERILTIRLMEKLRDCPNFAKVLEIEVLYGGVAQDAADRKTEE